MEVLDNEYVKGVMEFIGGIKLTPDYSDPLTMLSLILFSTELLVLILAVILWAGAALFKTTGKWGVKEQMDKADDGRESHRYDRSHMQNMSRKHKMGNINEMGNMHKMKQERGFLSLFINKFVFPVTVIFVILYAGISIWGAL